jgi:hypothetical protein
VGAVEPLLPTCAAHRHNRIEMFSRFMHGTLGAAADE